jgi:hypothetical protein
MPVPHTTPLHVHWPLEQSGSVAGHETHVAWFMPQALFWLPDAQRLVLSQQPGHVVSHWQVAVVPAPLQCSPTLHGGPEPHLHWPPVQRLAEVALHIWQLDPIVPQLPSDGIELHVSCAVQQPPAHEVAVQWQAPPTHSWPTGHAGPLPHWQAPEAQLFEW